MVPFSSIIIDPANPSQLNYWADELQVQPSDLKAAILIVGRRLGNIRSYLGKSAPVISLQDYQEGRWAKQQRCTVFPPVA
jgi:Protein of unknown function (DUF3606)